MFGNHFENKLLDFLATTGCASTSQLMQLHPDMGYKTNNQKIGRMEAKQMLQRIGWITIHPTGGRRIVWALTAAYARLLSAPEYLKTGKVFLEKGLLKAEYVLSNQGEHYPYLFKDKKALFERYSPWPFPFRGAIPLGTDALIYKNGKNIVCCLPIADTRSLNILSADVSLVFQEKIHLKLICHSTHKPQLESYIHKITSVEGDDVIRSLVDWKRYFNGLPSGHLMRKRVQKLISYMADDSVEQASLSDAPYSVNIEVIPYVAGAVFQEEMKG